MAAKGRAARIAIAAYLAFSLSSCATTEAYSRIVSSYVGQSEQTLVQSWGVPDSVYESGGIKFLTYRRNAQTVHGGFGGIPPYMITKHCTTTFQVKDAVVGGWRWEGNACKATE